MTLAQRHTIEAIYWAGEPLRRVLREIIRAEHRQRDRDAEVLRGIVPKLIRQPWECR